MSSVNKNRQGQLAYVLPSVLLIACLSLYLFRDDWMIVLIADFQDTVAAAYLANKALLLAIWLAATWTFLSMMRIFFWEGLVEQRRGQKVPVLLTNLFRLVILIIVAVMVATSVFNVSVMVVALLLGGTAAMIVVFLRDFLSELFAGLSINLDQGIDIGFNLALPNGVQGIVEEMNWRSVSMRLTDGTTAIVPNTLLAQQVVTNLNSLKDRKPVTFELTLDFSLAIERALRVLNAALTTASQLPGIATDPPPEAYANGPGTFGIIYRLRFHYHAGEISEGKARSIVTLQVMRHLSRTGLTISLPKQNVFLGEVRMMAKSWDNAFDRETLIGNIDVFESLDELELRKLAQSIVIHQVQAGTEIIRYGDTTTSMYGLAEGVLEVSVMTGDKQLVVATMEPGNFFGEMSMLADEPRSATVTALVDSTIFEVQRESFREILNGRPDLAESISEVIINRQTSNDAKRDHASREEMEQAASGASSNLLQRIRAVFSLFKHDNSSGSTDG